MCDGRVLSSHATSLVTNKKKSDGVDLRLLKTMYINNQLQTRVIHGKTTNIFLFKKHYIQLNWITLKDKDKNNNNNNNNKLSK